MKKAYRIIRIVFGVLIIPIIYSPRWYSALEANLRVLPFVKIAATQTGICYFHSPQVEGDYVITAAHIEHDEQKTKLVEMSTSEVAPFGSYLTLFWNSMVSLIVDVPIQNYELQVYGKHDRPGPVILRLSANDKILGTLTFAKDDDSWENLCLRLPTEYWQDLEKLTIQIEFANDGGVAGNRDAGIAGIRFIPFLPAASD